MNKKIINFPRPAKVASKSIVQQSDSNITRYKAIGKSNDAFKLNLQLLKLAIKFSKKIIIEILPNAKSKGNVIRVNAKRYAFRLELNNSVFVFKKISFI